MKFYVCKLKINKEVRGAQDGMQNVIKNVTAYKLMKQFHWIGWEKRSETN